MTTRFDKLDWLLDNCVADCALLRENIRELVAWMDEDAFNEFFNYKCSECNINHPFDADEDA